MTDQKLKAHDFKVPGITLTGIVDQVMYSSFRDQLTVARSKACALSNCRRWAEILKLPG